MLDSKDVAEIFYNKLGSEFFEDYDLEDLVLEDEYFEDDEVEDEEIRDIIVGKLEEELYTLENDANCTGYEEGSALMWDVIVGVAEKIKA